MKTHSWGWGLLGLAGSLLLTAASPRLLSGGAVTWWFDLRLAPGQSANLVAFYAGMVTLSVAWLGLGRLTRSGGAAPTQLRAIGALWCLPLVLAPALFSRDLYSYLAQGTIVHLGLSPYHYAPAVLGHLGRAPLLQAVSPFWRHTTAPYGPLFLSLVSLIVSVSGSNLIAGVLLARLLELGGIALLALYVPRLARILGANPSRAIWLAILNPLVLLELVAAGHNDALMAGLMVAGVTLALEGRPLLGVGLCAAAATIKLPALAGAVFIAVAWARTLPTRSDRRRAVAQAGLLTITVAAAVSVASTLGWRWISTGLFSTPGRVALAITPATAVGATVASLLHDVGIGVSARGLESTLGVVAFGITAALGLALLWRVRLQSLVHDLGLLLLAAALGGPAAWPWYFSWGLVLLACGPAAQRSRAIPVLLVASVFLVKPGGVLALALGTAPAFVIGYIVAGVAWYRHHRRGTPVRPERLLPNPPPARANPDFLG